MMNIKKQAHRTARNELVETMSIAFAVALFADASWILRDIVVNGGTIGLYLIALALWGSTVLVLMAIYKYHMQQVAIIVKGLTKERLKLCKRRGKNHRENSKKHKEELKK